MYVRAAAASYYALTGLVPFLGILVTLAAVLIPEGDGLGGQPRRLSVDQIRQTVAELLPDDASKVIGNELARLRQSPRVGVLTTGLILALWLSSGVFSTLMEALNRIAGVRETRPYWRVILTAIALTLFEAIVMLGVLFTLIVRPGIRGEFGGWAAPSLATLVEWVPIILVSLLSFAVTARFGPASAARWRWITPGGVFGTVAFLASSYLLRLYVAHWGNYGNTYGSLAGVMLLSTWFWSVALIYLVAFQVDRIIDEERGKQP